VQRKFPPYPANDYVLITPRIKETTPSVLMKYPQRLDGIQIQKNFQEKIMMNNFDKLLQAAERLEDNNVSVIIMIN